MSTLKLLRIAGYGGLFVSTSGILMHYLMQQRLRKSDHYKLSVLNILAHKPLCEHLGEPVGFGNVDLGNNKENYATVEEAKFAVPLKGTKKSGTLFFEASRDPSNENNRWMLKKLEVSISDRPNERVLVPIKYVIYSGTDAIEAANYEPSSRKNEELTA